MLASDQQQWTEAEHYFQQALEIFAESEENFKQAHVYYNLGLMSQEQRQLDLAEQYH